MGAGSNANIRSFIYLLLHSIYEQESHTPTFVKAEENNEGEGKLLKLKKLLLNEKLWLTKTVNNPNEVEDILREVESEMKEEKMEEQKNEG